MSDTERDARSPRSSDLLSAEEEARIREQVRNRLRPEVNGEMPHSTSDPSRRTSEKQPTRDREIISERLRIMREEEDRIYAEHGLYRYKNHRGEYEWLTQDQIDKRKDRRRRSRAKRPRESKSWVPQITSHKLDSVLGPVFSAALVLVILATAIYLIVRSGEVVTPYAIHVTSLPAGAAIFVDGVATGKTTDAYVHVERVGAYEISVHLPGHRIVPESFTVDVIDAESTQQVVFSLYPQESTE